MSEQSAPLIVLTGPTAAGKTPLAVQWAQQFNGEIIGADSRQIYRYMDIGTAKPGPQERAAAPHHLIDIVAPHQPFTLAQYQTAAKAVITDIQQRGRLPILCGGTGLYITATLEGWQMPEIPPDPVLRAELETLSNEALLAKLQALDPVTAAAIDAQNPRRLVRAVEVCLIAGQPFSELRRKQPLAYRCLVFVLTMPRESLYRRADQRIDQMIAAGWIDEMRDLQRRGYPPDLPALSALGYPQIGALLRGEMTLEQARQQIQYATHDFIRRQYTWIRGHGGDNMRWIELGHDASGAIGAFLEA